LKRNGNRTRRVRWNDGLANSDNLRKRSLLEQVYVYPKELAFENDEDQSRGGNLKQELDDEDQGTGTVKEELDDDGIPFG
jgi:hypothetical protein